MKAFVSFLLCFFACLISQAQDTVFVYCYQGKISGPAPREVASYYFLTNNLASPYQGLVSFYDRKGKLYAEISYDEAGKENGRGVFYYQNGSKSCEYTYRSGQIEGPYKYWYHNGELKQEGEALAPVKAGAGSEYLVNQYWDSLGNQLIVKGKGALTLYYKNGLLKEKGFYDEGRKVGQWEGFNEKGTIHYKEEYKEGKLVTGVSYKGEQVFPYSMLEEESQPLGGINAFYSFLSKNIKYPKKALKAGIQGTAYIRFVIDETGKVELAETVEGRRLGYGLDEEAKRVILLTEWVPGKQRGIVVKQRKILPIKFGFK